MSISAPVDKYPYVALVTGASRGIGLEFVRQFAFGRPADLVPPFGALEKDGNPTGELELPDFIPKDALIVATCRTPSTAAELNKLASQSNGRVRVVKLDVESDEDIQNVAALFTADIGRLDLLVNNAGITEERAKPIISNATRADLMRVVDVNAIAPVLITAALMPFLRRTLVARAEAGGFEPLVVKLPMLPDRKADSFIPKNTISALATALTERVTAGPQPASASLLAAAARSPVRVVFISSMLGSSTASTNNWSPGYRASKAALGNLARSVAFELQGVAVAAVHPGWVATDMGTQAGAANLSAAASVAGCVEVMKRMRADEPPAGIAAYDGYTWPF